MSPAGELCGRFLLPAGARWPSFSAPPPWSKRRVRTLSTRVRRWREPNIMAGGHARPGQRGGSTNDRRDRDPGAGKGATARSPPW